MGKEGPGTLSTFCQKKNSIQTLKESVKRDLWENTQNNIGTDTDDRPIQHPVQKQ